MALRVLLADENVTIKKVIQLSLQDYAVSVKSVNLGVDVLDVARDFQPDVVFADILLQKRNGYEVCTDFKNDSSLANIPFVLMWSNFMEIDRDRFTSCGADADLEKPFDKEALRRVIQETVEKVKSNEMAQFVETVDPPPMEVSAPQGTETPELIKPIDSPAPPAPQTTENEGSWNMDSFDEIGDFIQKPLGQVAGNIPSSEPEKSEDWVQQPTPALDELPSDAPATDSSDLSKFKLELDTSPQSPAAEFDIDYSAAEGASADQAVYDNVQDMPPTTASADDEKQPDEGTEEIAVLPKDAPSLTREEVERIVAKQSREVIESIAWKIIPDLAEKLIRERLDELMKEADL